MAPSSRRPFTRLPWTQRSEKWRYVLCNSAVSVQRSQFFIHIIIFHQVHAVYVSFFLFFFNWRLASVPTCLLGLDFGCCHILSSAVFQHTRWFHCNGIVGHTAHNVKFLYVKEKTFVTWGVLPTYPTCFTFPLITHKCLQFTLQRFR